MRINTMKGGDNEFSSPDLRERDKRDRFVVSLSLTNSPADS